MIIPLKALKRIKRISQIMKMMILIGNCGLKVNETFIKVVRGVINHVNQEYVD